MGVYKRLRKLKDGKKTAYYYSRNWVNGREFKKSLGKAGIITKETAKQMDEEIRRKIRIGQYEQVNVIIPTLSEFSSKFIEYQRHVKQKRSWKKDESHMVRINKILGHLKLSEITIKHIDDYKITRVQKVKPVTVNRELEVFRTLFFLAKSWKKYFGENPVSQSRLIPTESQRIRVLTLDEEDRLLSVCSKHLRPIIDTALLTGMRQGELLALRWDDVNFENNLLTISAKVSKSKKERRIPISRILRKILLEQKLKTSTSFVFVTQEDKPYSQKNFRNLKRTFTTAKLKAKIEDFKFHDLRHTAATRMAENGASIIAVQNILGHADIKTTMKYFHPGNSLTEAVEILGKLKYNRTQNRTQLKYDI